VALNQRAWQSSMNPSFEWCVAGKAIDGKRDTSSKNDSCSCTDSGDVTPWLAVDLGEVTYVYGVNVTNGINSGVFDNC
jgi:hypothetical protein